MDTLQPRTPAFLVQRSAERFRAQHGWLDTYHSFSFADYLDSNNLNWGALRVFNDDTIAPGQGFPTHPHRDMEIITYVLSGELEHRDSMGNHGVVTAGGVQYMSAGTGVRHSEFNGSQTTPLHLVQMWVLPSRQGQEPQYGQREFDQDARTNTWLLIASGRSGAHAPITIRQDAAMSVARLEGASVDYALTPDRYAFLFVASGDVEANGEALGSGDSVRITGLDSLAVRGNGKLVLWDVPPLRA